MKTPPEDQFIVAWTGDAAYRRGRQYAAEGRVLYPHREGDVLLALCRGQAIEPYRVQVRLSAGEVVAARCTCPVGAEGRCKHVAAVLVLWQRHPETFRPLPPLAAFLEGWSKRDLIAVIVRMVARDPDLRAFVLGTAGVMGEEGNEEQG